MSQRKIRGAQAGRRFVAALAAALAPALAQDVAPDAHAGWPSRPVKLIVPSSPGGGTDLFARLLAAGLSEAFHQQFIVENRPGASGNIGAEAAAKAPPDGYTFLVSASPAIVINPSLYKDLPYDAARAFTPVARGVASPLVYVVHASVPARTLGELVALGKSAPGKLTYGSAGQGSTTYLGVRLLEAATGAKFTHIPYKGLGQAYQGLLSGQIDFVFGDVATVLAHIRSGRVVALAISDRTSQLPDVPTLVQAGFPDVEANASFMVVAPAGTPRAIVIRVNAAISALLKSPAAAEKLDAHVLIPFFETPDEFAVTLAKERAMWSSAIRRMDIQPE